MAFQQASYPRIRRKSEGPDVRRDPVCRQPIPAPTSAEEIHTQQDADADAQTIAGQTLTKIHSPKVGPVVPSQAMIAVRDLSFRYTPETPLLRFPDFECPPGDRLLVLGQSGSGKTTLLHLMSGLLHPASGRIEVAGTVLNGMSGKALDRFRGRSIGIVFQRPHFVASLTVLENLLLPAFLAGERPDRARALGMLEDLGVGAKASRRPRDLSVGEQQRVGIARALVHRPAVVLADEPTSALDDRSTEAVVALLERTAGEAGATLVVVTHDARLTARYPRRLDLTAS